MTMYNVLTSVVPRGVQIHAKIQISNEKKNVIICHVTRLFRHFRLYFLENSEKKSSLVRKLNEIAWFMKRTEFCKGKNVWGSKW